MNLIGSVNIQMTSRNGTSETMVGFATPKSNKEAMDAAKKAIKDEMGKTVTDVRRSPPQYAKDWQWTAWNGTKHLAWICFNEVTVKGNKMKLIFFSPAGLNWFFKLELNGETKEIQLKEKSDWPVLLGQNIDLVEKWLFANYFDICKMVFGLI